jgi:F0F1-type ATP synthase assembly protein I
MKKRKSNEQKNHLYFIAKYSGLAFEMLGIIVLGVFAGVKLDKYLHTEFPLWTLILTLLAVFVSLYFVIKGVLNNGTKS